MKQGAMQTIASIKAFESRVMQCPEHGEVVESYIDAIGQWSGCPMCAHEAAKAQSQAEVAQAQQARTSGASESLMKRRIQAEIPRRFRDKSLDNFAASTPELQRNLRVCSKYVSRFKERFENGGGLVLMGKPGTGKTHLATAIGNALIESGYSVLFTDVYDLIDTVKESAFDKKLSSEREAIRKFARYDLLILDEVGAQLGTDWERLTLFKIINERYKECRPTLLITNLDRESFTKYAGERIVDRMTEGGGAFLSFTGESYRSGIYAREKAA